MKKCLNERTAVSNNKKNITKRCFSAAAAVLAAMTLFSGCTSEETKENASSDTAKVSSRQSDNSSESSAKTEQSKNTSKAESSAQDSSEASHTAYTNTITPTVWEVTDTDGNKMYMMGTIHLADKSVEHMPDYFETVFAESDAVALECDTSSAAISIDDVINYMYTDGTTIKDHVSAEDYTKVTGMAKEANVYSMTYEYVKPFMWASLLEIAAGNKSGLSSDYGVDSIIQSRASKEGKEVIEVEGVDFQNELIASLPDEIQEYMFHEIAAQDNYMDELTKQIKDMYEDWKAGNEISETETSGEESLTEHEKELTEEYQRMMLTDRNKGMADKAKEYIKSGKTVLFAVGAAHFSGDEGIKKLMEDSGYTFRKLTSADAKQIADVSEEASALDGDVSYGADTIDPSVPRAA